MLEYELLIKMIVTWYFYDLPLTRFRIKLLKILKSPVYKKDVDVIDSFKHSKVQLQRWKTTVI